MNQMYGFEGEVKTKYLFFLMQYNSTILFILQNCSYIGSCYIVVIKYTISDFGQKLG